ncbi:MAG: zinc transporter, family [Chloroflexota bacterium]|nr:zinc transporter, family [Chloroflexota bacterium]
MSFAETVLLGSIAGLTIFLGLPLARVRVVAPRHLAFLNALAIGILFFLFFDIVEHAIEPVEEAIRAEPADLPLLLGVLIAGFGIGLLSLVYYMRRASSGAGFTSTKLAIAIAVGIGLHNFSEGLAIGSSAQRGDLALALTLVIGFGLHNVTEAFGIAAPLAGKRPSWALLGLVGLIGGGPNFAGTIIGYTFSSPPVSVLFLSVAAGALVFVIGELFASGRKLSSPLWNGWGIGIGFFAGLLTDFILIAVGA